ncbi:MAG TPA: hypothetical protein QGF50_03740 [Roseibacillus sp.]|nr:hypothetical protein [Roseibacillus sp.]
MVELLRSSHSAWAKNWKQVNTVFDFSSEEMAELIRKSIEKGSE